MGNLKDLSGQKFGRLTVISRHGLIPKKPRGHRITWLCICQCGKEKIALGEKLQCGKTKSCGCIRLPEVPEANEKTKRKIKKFTYINTRTGCWEWQKYKNELGYGYTSYRGKQLKAHRVSWIVFRGEIPSGVCVLHKCDNPKCVNPDHLYLGSMKDNVRDMMERGRNGYGVMDGMKQHNAKFTNEDVLWIRAQECTWENCKEFALKFGASPHTIWNIFRRKTWKHLHDQSENLRTL